MTSLGTRRIGLPGTTVGRLAESLNTFRPESDDAPRGLQTLWTARDGVSAGIDVRGRGIAAPVKFLSSWEADIPCENDDWSCEGSFGYREAAGNLRSLHVRYEVISVPEPASWALMILGVGVVGQVLRRGASAALPRGSEKGPPKPRRSPSSTA